ncbi:MAG: DUF1801 domain-containing protein [Actinobacteria bacterium]|nr:DUF1801 domain-containing protein [Actinomycetota bacterium]
MARPQFATVEEFLAAQTPQVRSKVELLRTLVTDAEPGTVEAIKWNSPNFSLAGEDRLTVNVDGKGAVRLILHRGTGVAEHKGATTRFTGDPHALLTWHSDIRASLPVTDDLNTDAARAIVLAWLAY